MGFSGSLWASPLATTQSKNVQIGELAADSAGKCFYRSGRYKLIGSPPRACIITEAQSTSSTMEWAALLRERRKCTFEARRRRNRGSRNVGHMCMNLSVIIYSDVRLEFGSRQPALKTSNESNYATTLFDMLNILLL